ncbi:hypothetical protein FQN54_006215 [Arachnomyces sp. PD_36]|nr:hypothetical protein FQN54_006215 [Arachnomyces sp. PD_36]
MESPLLEDFFAKQWKSVTESCAERMEPHDRKIIRCLRTPEDVNERVFVDQDEEASKASLQELAMLQPRLIDLKSFSEFFAKQLGPGLDTDMFWGMLGLLLTLALQHDETMRRVVRMLKKLSRNCHDFLLYCQQSPIVTKENKESCFVIFLTIAILLAEVVQLLRQAENDLLELTSARARHHPVWNDFTEKLTTAVGDIDDTLNRMERATSMYQRHFHGDMASSFLYASPQPGASRDTALLPCFVLPPSRTSRFFGREDVIEKLGKHFQEGDPAPSLRSLALYGMGGVGKSLVAMKYLEKKQLAKEFDAIFWINAENPVSIQQSFTDIALRLKLPDTGRDTHDQNRTIVKSWLQESECKWMMIYDNAQTCEVLQEYWPLPGSDGQVLITTRNNSLGFDPAEASLEMLPWDTNTGSEFLLHFLEGQIRGEFFENESRSAYSLSEKLRGHPLALSNAGGLIIRRSWSISDVLEAYNKSKDLNDGLETVWQPSFENLSSDCAGLLSIFTYCGPDSIPLSLFEVNEETEGLTEDMLRYLDSDRFVIFALVPNPLPAAMNTNNKHTSLGTSTEELLALALIKRDRYDRVFSVYRLIATQFRRYLNPKDRQKAFFEASILIYNAFPKRQKQPEAIRANLYNAWDKCQLWLPHVLQLKMSFMEERKRDPSFSACRETCETWVQCQRYLLETQNWPELEGLVDVNKIAMATLPEPDKEIYLLSSTEIHVSSMWAFRGRFKMALNSLQIAHDLKLTESPIDVQNTCWIADNLATIHGCLEDWDTAIQWVERSRTMWNLWSELTDAELKYPPLLKLTHGRILSHSGRHDEAWPQLIEAMDGFLCAEPFVWAPAAICKFAIGRLLMFEGKYDAAESMLLESQSMWLRGDKSNTLDFNGILVYQLGCCALQQGRIGAALDFLDEAKTISSIHKKTHPAKYARCLFNLSEALRQAPGRALEADRHLNEAKDLYLQTTCGASESTMEELKDSPLSHSCQVKVEDFNVLIHISQR